MRDGKALQMGTSHELGQNFARVFEIEFLDDAGERQTAWTTSWGASHAHGRRADHGPRRRRRPAACRRASRTSRSSCSRSATTATWSRAAARSPTSCAAAGVRVHLDDRADVSLGRRATDWELKGVPLRLELGPATSPTARPRSCDARDGAKERRSRSAGIVERGARAARRGTGRAARRGHARARRAHTPTSVPSTTARDAADVGLGARPVGRRRHRGRGASSRTSGVDRACLHARRRLGARRSEDEPDLVAYVARTY